MIKRGLVPVALTRCHQLKKAYKKGQRVFPAFGEFGRTRTMGVEKFDSMVEDQVEAGNTLGLAEVKAELLAHQMEVNTANGMSNIGVSISSKTVGRYKAAAAMNDKTKVTNSAIDKTESRHIAERSKMSVMSQAAVAAVSMFVPVDGPGSDSELARMVSKASGGIGVQPVKDILTFSTDDTTGVD